MKSCISSYELRKVPQAPSVEKAIEEMVCGMREKAAEFRAAHAERKLTIKMSREMTAGRHESSFKSAEKMLRKCIPTEIRNCAEIT